MLEMKPDPMSEKARKRRSSRTGGLTSKDPWANTFLFRTVPEERYNIYDWQITMKPQLTPEGPEDSPLSPSAQFSSFTNPFASRDVRTPASSARPELQQRTSSQTTSTYPHAPRERDRSAMISPSPSLRSRRSDLSSQASSQHPPMGFPHQQNYTTALPTDLPSPASMSGYEPQFIEGWTSAQGRSSALSSHTRGSNSIASAVAPIAPIASTPPGPRETILDRAFQMRCIPGSERVPEKDESLSSIARFEALMREVDERKQQKALASQSSNGKGKEEWNLDEDSHEESDSAEPEIGSEDDDDVDGLEMSDNEVAIPTPAQRALDYISGRRTPIPSNSRPLSPTPKSPPIPFLNPQAMSAFHGGGGGSSSGGGLRPRTGTDASNRRNSRPTSLALPGRSVSAATVPTLKDAGVGSSSLKTSTDVNEKRRSSTSVKRLSFQEFAKRLSSTSSLLLVQTNASSSSGRDGSRRGSSEYGEVEEKSGLRGGELKGNQNQDKRCGWRGSVGVFGGEGGFL
jgi:hypothetical protein